ncbi:hypothetical protein IFM89_020665 [Coptis chinensis]|uniref:DUF4005 domain-containing protein n=1 Tax=Coptis chinensis TaxID=261450 RepID=A0A835H0B7_9MAGN|nr:hypothetical protein IFM89_020665 [Coptis chinensis]
MAKMGSWVNLLKKLFVSEAKATPEKNGKRRRWIIGRFKWKRVPALACSSLVKDRSLVEAEKEHSKHALTVAIATAAAAEAALASAKAAAEVVRLTSTPMVYLTYKRGSRESAAIKIQTSFRGYLARKALRALKGLVRLQAMVRGQAVRRQVISTLNGLQTLVKIQSQLRGTREGMEDKQLIKNFNELGKPKVKNHTGLVDTLPPKEDFDALLLSRHNGLVRREHVKEYSFSNRDSWNSKISKESEANGVNGRLNHWLEESGEAQERKCRISINSNLFVTSSPVQRNVQGRTEHRLGELKHNDLLLAGRSSPISTPRRSFDRPRRSSIEDSDSLGSPVLPNYMSATESVKARLRSISLPKQRQGLVDTYSDHGSPYKDRLIFSSFSTDASTIVKSGKSPSFQQRSPSLKGLLIPRNSHPSAKDISINSESSILNRVQHGGLK